MTTYNIHMKQLNIYLQTLIITILIVVSFIIVSCASSPRFTSDRIAEPNITTSPSPSMSSRAQTLQTYEGMASFYAHDFHGKKTANGEIFNMRAKTAAHRSFPFNTKVRVTNLSNNKSVIVRVNDRGPFKLERIMDLSMGAAEELDMIKSGTAKVRLEVIEWGK